MLAFAFTLAFAAVGVGVGEAVGVGVGEAAGLPAVIVTSDAILIVFGGRQTESLQT